MQYTLRNIPKRLDAALRRKAKVEAKSLNDAAIEALTDGLGLAAQPTKRRDLSNIAGTWVEDPAFDEAIRDQDRIDPDMWK